MILRSRLHPWTCTKFADLIRGTEKPFALGWDEWDEWHKNAKNKRPFRYWLAETGLEKLQNFLYFPSDLYHIIDTYVRNRWIDKIHYLKTGLKPGTYCDLDTRILHGLFNELVDFVETDLSHLSRWDRNKKYKFKNGRCVEAAYDYFEWATNLKYDEDYGNISPNDPDYGKPTQQAKDALKIKELYEWWTKERPNRYNPHDIITKEMHGEHYYRLIDEMERSYDREDTDKLIELIKIRGALWT
jgi:hypothetical protein